MTQFSAYQFVMDGNQTSVMETGCSVAGFLLLTRGKGCSAEVGSESDSGCSSSCPRLTLVLDAIRDPDTMELRAIEGTKGVFEVVSNRFSKEVSLLFSLYKNQTIVLTFFWLFILCSAILLYAEKEKIVVFCPHLAAAILF